MYVGEKQKKSHSRLKRIQETGGLQTKSKQSRHNDTTWDGLGLTISALLALAMMILHYGVVLCDVGCSTEASGF